jgi:hypothetical protein
MQCNAVQKSIIDFTEYDDTASETNGRDAPALLTTLRWSSGVDPEAVLLSPAEVRRTWHDFKQVCFSNTSLCACQNGSPKRFCTGGTAFCTP